MPDRRLVERVDEKLGASVIGGDPVSGIITVREVLRLLWEADSYPRIGNTDWPEAARMEAEALGKAETAMTSPDDPLEFARWLEALQNRDLPMNDREEIYWALHDYFGGADGRPQDE